MAMSHSPFTIIVNDLVKLSIKSDQFINPLIMPAIVFQKTQNRFCMTPTMIFCDEKLKHTSASVSAPIKLVAASAMSSQCC